MAGTNARLSQKISSVFAVCAVKTGLAVVIAHRDAFEFFAGFVEHII
mgnify:FL=1